ncbi:MAG: carbohydrate-binding family 9-like protein [Bryobacteraceae bacterium]|nr:carbohydrate-binding family 9-like protein [Bryobacteraceae bacterium]
MLILSFAAWSADSATVVSRRAAADFELSADPESSSWKGVSGITFDTDNFGKPVAGHRTEVRTQWTDKHIYFLFTCPYQELYLKPNPQTAADTPKLWDWDVAEVFVGTDFSNIYVYKEFELSPQGEWIDLDINAKKLRPEVNMKWNSGWQVKARIDKEKKIWYGEMKIPIASIDKRPPKPGVEMRINFYRAQGPPERRVYMCWRPTNDPSFHNAAAFGTLRLE